jgi:phosphoglycerate dehydrogenase-like enzyme
LPRNANPLAVLVAFPADPPPDQLRRLHAFDDRITLRVVPYEEPGEFRALRRARIAVDALREVAPTPPAEFADALRHAEVMVGFDVPLHIAAAAPRLRWVQTTSTGIDQLWGAELGAAGVHVTNVVGAAAVSIAEFAMARILGIWKRFRELDEQQRARRWTPTYGKRLAGSTIGIVGLGSIGNEIAARARAFGMTVLGVRRSPERGPGSAHEVFAPGDLHRVLERCDVVVVCAPSTSETTRLIDDAALRSMRAGSILVNIARGGHVDERALVDALASGHLGAAAIDVTGIEPLPPDSELWDVPNLYISPHSSGSLDGYWEAVYDVFVDNLDRYLGGRPLRNLVDLDRGYVTQGARA